jgi:hypothetical protein
MRLLPILLCTLPLTACAAAPLPEADPAQAWVELYSTPGNTLMAEKLDGKKVGDGRFFQVTPGSHELRARFQFDVNNGSGGGTMGNPRQLTCHLKVKYDFIAGQRYRLEARPVAMSTQAWLYSMPRKALKQVNVEGCGPL